MLELQLCGPSDQHSVKVFCLWLKAELESRTEQQTSGCQHGCEYGLHWLLLGRFGSSRLKKTRLVA
eukprot:m.18755 g.18755  ORF g.18755 m.18755 type:complete len:66 (-) comp10852_c1_seq9:1137-1334(-)